MSRLRPMSCISSLPARGWARCRDSCTCCACKTLGVAARATRRFSTLGAIAVTLVTASGARECLVPGGRRAGADRHRLRATPAREARAVRGDAGPGNGQSVASVHSSPKRGSRSAAFAPAQCDLGNRSRNRRRGDRRGARRHGSRGPPGTSLAVRAHVELEAGGGLGMAAGDSGGGRRHRPHVGRNRSRGLSPRTHAPMVVGSRGCRGVRRAIGLDARRARPPHDVCGVTRTLHDGEHRPRQRTLRGELPRMPRSPRSRRRPQRPLLSDQAAGSH